MNNEVICKDDLFAGRWVPYRLEVLRSPALSDGAKLLYAEICSYFFDNKSTIAWPSQELLARNLGVSLSAIKRRTDELVEVGVISVRRVGLGRSNHYSLLRPDPICLKVRLDAGGSPIPVISELSGSVISAESAQMTNLDSAQMTNLDPSPVIDENLIAGASSSIPAQAPVIDAEGGITIIGNNKKINNNNPPQSQFSNSTTDSKETVVEPPKENLGEIDKPKGNEKTNPNYILFSRIPDNTRVIYHVDGTPAHIAIDGKLYLIIDDRTTSKKSTAAAGDVVQEIPPIENNERNEDAAASALPVVASSEIQPANSIDVDADMKCAVTDGKEEYDSVEGECPTCGSGLYYECGRVKCLQCEWDFGYRKFKERFLAKPEDDVLVSPEQAHRNKLNLQSLLRGDVPQKSEGECLLNDLKEVMSETRVVKPSTSSFVFNVGSECSIDTSMEKKEQNDKVKGNGNGGKRSKEEILRWAKMMDAAAKIEGEVL